MIDLDLLEARAKAATPGPWLERHEDVYSEVDAHVAFCLTVCSSADEHCITKKQAQANAAYIAAANPQVVLELLARLRKTKAERDWLAGVLARTAQEWIMGKIKPFCPSEVCHQRADQKNCVNCWLEAAREAVEEKK